MILPHVMLICVITPSDLIDHTDILPLFNAFTARNLGVNVYMEVVASKNNILSYIHCSYKTMLRFMTLLL